jgi:membrane complex biogenesis BtpA family protein
MCPKGNFAPFDDGSRVAVVGMPHLAPLPGAPRHTGGLGLVRERLLRDAEGLAEEGVAGLMMENVGDIPFFLGRVPAHTVAYMTALAAVVRRRFGLPLGINCLRNDAVSALAIAHAVGVGFIRVNVLCGARVTDQGVIQRVAHEVLRERKLLAAEAIRILADVDVKHSAPLGAEGPLADEVRDVIERGLADAVVVSGSATGLAQVREAKGAAGDAPVLVGSGVTVENVRLFFGVADGLIIGTAFQEGGVAANPVDPGRVRELMARLGG